MIKPIYRKKRSKATKILLAPIFGVVFLVGWTLVWIGQSGQKQKQKPINKTPQEQDELELMVIPKEEQTVTV